MKARVILKKENKLEIVGGANGAVSQHDYLPISDFLMGEDATVGSADSPGGAAGSLEVSDTHNLDAGHLGTLSLLFDVLNSKLATRGLHLTEAV